MLNGTCARYCSNTSSLRNQKCTKKALWLRLHMHACIRIHTACPSQIRQNVSRVDKYSSANCEMGRLVNVRSCSVCSVASHHRSGGRFGAVPRTGSTANHSTVRNIPSNSVETLRTGCWQGKSCRLLSDRPMPFKRSALLWLAGAFVISAAAAQGAPGKVVTVVGHAMQQQACPDPLAHCTRCRACQQQKHPCHLN